MPYKLRIPSDTVSLIRGLHPQLKKKIRAALLEISDNPHIGKALRNELNGLWNYRIKKIRIIYRFTGKKFIDIIAIGPRTNIYEETYKLLKNKNNPPIRRTFPPFLRIFVLLFFICHFIL